MATLLGVLSLALSVLHAAASDATGKDHDRLIDHLFDKKLHPFTRPVQNLSSAVKYRFGLALLNFESLDEVTGNLQLSVWFRQLWKDEYLTWNPKDFNGIDHTRIPTDNLWTPDIVLYNARGDTEYFNAKAVLSSDGTILYIPPARTKSHCDLDLTYFPYDKQVCSLKFGSWTYDGFKIDLELYDGLEGIDISDYQHNLEWDIVSTSAKKNVKYYPCCAEPYPDLTYTLTIQRKTSYYTYVYLGPAVVLSLLAPFIFLLPPGDQQKMTLGVGLLVCLTLFFMEMATLIPIIHSHTPLIDRYYMTVYVLVSIAMALSTLVSNLARRTISFRHPPEFIKKILLSCLGRCLCVSYNMYGKLPIPEEPKDDGSGIGIMQRQTSSENQVKEWLLIATVVDRLLFLVYLVLTVLLTIIILSVRG